MTKKRVDLLLVERGLAKTRSKAQRLVMAGQVRADGQIVPKPSTKLSPSAVLEVEQGLPFVSRGGEKLAAALEAFDFIVDGAICADIGASTGGFTDCLLQNGAAKVYAIDVGQGILHWKLRQDMRVVVMEGTNARYVKTLPEPITLITIDASFISLKVLLPVITGWFPKQGGQVVALVKPQFEAGRKEATRGKGVIRDPEIHSRILGNILTCAQEIGFGLLDLIVSPLKGPKGNIEFLVHLEYPSDRPQNIEDKINTLFTF
jgi:23S rRNA (cytidine1920-2'-O)/16S rRNA (cytidine1409-2'-O)-methyltransferase